MLHHGFADGSNDVAAKNDILLHGRISQVEIAVFQTLQFIGFTAAVDFKRKLIVTAFAENFYFFRNNLYVTGILFGVGIGTGTDSAFHRNGGFLVNALDLCDEILIFNDNLCRAVEIAHHDERKVAADHTDVFHPAGDFYLLPDMLEAKLIAGMCSVLHTFILL